MSTPDPTTPATTTNDTPRNGGRGNSGRGNGGRSNGGRGGRGGRGRGGSNRNTTPQVQSSDGTSFEGACPDVGAVIGLRTEKMTKKVPFAIFKEKLADYVIRSIKYGSDIEECIRQLQDPTVGF